jgi:hypothetical protein
LRPSLTVANCDGSPNRPSLRRESAFRGCVLKLFERVYAPLTAGLLSPVGSDARIPDQKRSQLDRLYHRVIDDIDALVEAVGLKAAA